MFFLAESATVTGLNVGFGEQLLSPLSHTTIESYSGTQYRTALAYFHPCLQRNLGMDGVMQPTSNAF